ncbi:MULTISPECIES: sigma-54-dependent Fis family transcriptional regulator [unclassified Caballeronia]|uniref:sigma-54-dependent Fis family transcriptional regulator n=1 Tax=unclassified Caballeronia TaxID=2646786 RepID=UPI0028559FF9|nr:MULTISPECIES: sigma-54-dependent Fis family transcriptional regulator [unclassified Caballeronia]MDR5752926.1 sigma-54-dependent Fis family transcriptional regulator [Caballeronia sp. LZ024]MDR5841213.1 sigma-54-dependent Fis family transcriptional regulator [Caballeronia sp. LZ031]
MHNTAGHHVAALGETSWLAPSICTSHQRSEAFGLKSSSAPDYDVLPVAELRVKLEQNRVLCAHALPVMATLQEQIVNTQSMIVLTDAQGLVLHSTGDDDFLRRAEKVALRPGANWAEDRQGTNAIGTAIAERCPMVVHGEQHYLAANRFLTCSSVPILDPYGELIGVLDVTGDHRSYHQHTMALAKMSVQMIENHLFASTFGETLRIGFHGRREFLGTLMEGMAAFTCDGRFLSANRSAQFQFGLPLAALRAHTLSSLFGLTASQLIDRVNGSHGQPIPLCLPDGIVVSAKVEHRRETVTASERPASRPYEREREAPAPRASAGGGLARLDTGDARVAAVIGKVRKVIDRDIPILITGETGTGKELLAQAIHHDSPRASGPFVAVNCASIPETLIESELFGYEEGAFTGARRKGATGKLLQANGGTLFLDEIGDMPYPLQVRLLRVLQERLVNPLGSAKSIPVDVAIICATHRDLREMIAENRFREDLYYRLNGLVVKLPPLRDRSDLRTVVQRMLQQETSCAAPLSIAPDVMQLFERCRWPGNFRQLGNLLRTAAAMVDDDGEIRIEHLPDDFFDDVERGAAPGTTAALNADADLHTFTASAITAALARHNGNVSAAARSLGISRNTIYRRVAVGARTDDA